MKPKSRQTLIAVLIAMVLPTVVTWVYFILFSGQSALIGGVCKLAQFAFPACWVFLMMRLSIREAGPPATKGGHSPWPLRTNLCVGVGLGAAIVFAMIAYYRFGFAPEVFNHFVLEVESRVEKLSLSNPWGYAALGVFYSLIHSFLEEYYFRWFVFGRLRDYVSFLPAAVLSGLSFMAHHVIVLHVFLGFSFHTLFLSLCIAVGGFLWAWQYERSRSLVGSWISHLIVDAGIFALGYHMIFVVLAK